MSVNYQVEQDGSSGVSKPDSGRDSQPPRVIYEDGVVYYEGEPKPGPEQRELVFFARNSEGTICRIRKTITLNPVST